MTEGPTPRDEMDALLNATLKFAKHELDKRGAFHPFGATVDRQGQVGMAMAYTGEEHPDSSDVIETLTETFRQEACDGEIRACAICCDVTITSDETGAADAIRVTIEHAQGDPVHVMLPYRRRRLRGASYGEVYAVEAPRDIFVPPVDQ